MAYDVVIGLEVHCELTSNSKNFSGSANSYSEEPNIFISERDLAFPGTLPVINEEGVRKALKMALAMNCTTPEEIIFDRKNYYYPDLPGGYQITQATKPVGVNGFVVINVDGVDKKVLIHQTHLEEDTASLDHYSDYSLIDYNRAGVPLLETVTEPCLTGTEDTIAFLEALRSIFLYTETSEARSDMGQMRCDVNISLKPQGSETFGTKVEIKNINSFNSVKLAIEYEIKRQTKMLNNGEEIIQETRGFSEENLNTYSMRSKADAIDYKYFQEPNIPPIKITKKFIEEIKKEIPPLQYERINKYMADLNLPRYDATILVKEKAIADYFEEILKYDIDPKEASNWISIILLGYLNKHEVSVIDIFVKPKMLADLIKAVLENKVSRNQAKDVLYQAIEEKKEPLSVIESSGMSQISDDDSIRAIVIEVIKENPDIIEQYKSGKDRVLDFLVGQVMKKTKGKASPPIASKLMLEEIAKT